MTTEHGPPPPRLLAEGSDEAMRRDLAAVAAFDAGYDVEAGAARFEAAIGGIGAGSGTAGTGSGSAGPGAGTAGAGSGSAGATAATAAAGKGGVLFVAVVGAVVAGGVVWALAGGPRDEAIALAPRADAPIEVEPARAPEPDDADVPSEAPPVARAVDPPAVASPSPETASTGDAEASFVQSRKTRPRAHTPASPTAKDDDALEREMAATHAAKRALDTNPSRALELAKTADDEFPKGPFAEDREGIEILALYALGKRSAADARADRFLSAHPHGTYADRVRDAREEAKREKP